MAWIKRIWYRIRLEIKYRQRMKEIKKTDPFTYK